MQEKMRIAEELRWKVSIENELTLTKKEKAKILREIARQIDLFLISRGTVNLSIDLREKS